MLSVKKKLIIDLFEWLNTEELNTVKTMMKKEKRKKEKKGYKRILR